MKNDDFNNIQIPDISIIIPVYNVECYLEECLNSIINQNTSYNYEVIVVNDGSTDDSEIIIDKFVKQYKFIIKINKVNSGLGAARNTGIRLASGKYIGFVDSDDFIDLNMIDSMLNAAKRTESDIVISDIEAFRDNNREKKYYLKVKKIFYNKKLTNKDILKLYLTDRIKGFAWNKIYIRSLFNDNNILYEEDTYYEDIYTTLKLFTYANSFYLIHEPYYKYRQRNGSIVRGATKKHLENYIFSIRKCVDFMSTNEVFFELEDYKKAFEVTSMNSILSIYHRCFNLNIKWIRKNYNHYFYQFNYKLNFHDIFISNIIPRHHKKQYILNKFDVIYIYMKKIKRKIKNYRL